MMIGGVRFLMNTSRPVPYPYNRKVTKGHGKQF